MKAQETCGYWDGERSCRNKPYATRTLWNGTEVPGLCRKHTIQELEKFRRDNASLAWFLKYAHLLDEDGAR